MESPITVASPRFSEHVESLVLKVLRSGQIAQGEMVSALEDLGCEMTGASHAVAVSNGTVSLEAALEALGVGPGDEVITSPLTFGATLNAILRSGATVRFADVADDFTVDPECIATLVSPRTVCLMPVHLYGLPADMPRILSISKVHDLSIIEDAAQAHGASIEGRRVGSYGVGSFSFYATKNVASGEGGMITTSDASIARYLRLLRNQGMASRYEYEIIGRNLRLTDLQAAVAIPQLRELDQSNLIRQMNAAFYLEALSTDDRISLPIVPKHRTHVWNQFTILLSPEIDRNEIVMKMAGRGVHAGIYYPKLVADYEVYKEHPNVRNDPTPRAADVARRCLSLPVHNGLNRSDLERVLEVLRWSMSA